jgi:hypothetical protein
MSSKSEKVIELLKTDKTANEIAKEVGCNQNYVYSVKSALRKKTNKKVNLDSSPKGKVVSKTKRSYPKNRKSNGTQSHYSSIQKLKKIIMDQAVEIAELRIKQL